MGKQKKGVGGCDEGNIPVVQKPVTEKVSTGKGEILKVGAKNA